MDRMSATDKKVLLFFELFSIETKERGGRVTLLEGCGPQAAWAYPRNEKDHTKTIVKPA